MRLFVCVRPSAAACHHLATALGREVDARWHVTLAFLGERPTPDLAPVAARHAPFPLALSGATRLGRAVATGVRGDVHALTALARDVRRACEVVERRRYVPHLTVGGGTVPAALRDYEGPAFTVSEVELVRSVLGRTAVHETLQRLPLG